MLNSTCATEMVETDKGDETHVLHKTFHFIIHFIMAEKYAKIPVHQTVSFVLFLLH